MVVVTFPGKVVVVTFPGGVVAVSLVAPAAGFTVSGGEMVVVVVSFIAALPFTAASFAVVFCCSLGGWESEGPGLSHLTKTRAAASATDSDNS